MGRKKKENEEFVKLERIETKKKNYVSESFYYLLGIVLSIILIFATKEFLSTINYLFVIAFAVISVVQIIDFIMDKEYEKKNYSGLMVSIICIWLAIFVFKYGSFIFLEMLPVLVSLVLYMMSISSFIKYFDRKINGNLIVGIISFVLGTLLMVMPGNVIYILFKITGTYVLVMIILDFIDYKKKKDDKNL